MQTGVNSELSAWLFSHNDKSKKYQLPAPIGRPLSKPVQKIRLVILSKLYYTQQMQQNDLNNVFVHIYVNH